MQINVSGKQVDLSDSLRTRVASSLDVIAQKYFDHALEAHVTFGRARSFFTCDINVHAGRGLTLRGEGEAGDANAAFDDAAEHIATRLRRYRRRVNDHHRALAQRERPQTARAYILRAEPDGDVPAPAQAETGQAETGHAEAGHAETGHAETGHAEMGHAEMGQSSSPTFATIIAETQTEITELTVSDAVMRMDLANQMVLMFRNSATGQLNVIYRRADGNIGWIDPANT